MDFETLNSMIYWEDKGHGYVIRLKSNAVLSRLGDLTLPCPEDKDLTILHHSSYSESFYQTNSLKEKMASYFMMLSLL